MKASTLRSLRLYHHYIGVFLAPAILFFSFSGLIQVIGIQDQRNPPPPGWVSYMAGIHKHQMPPKPRPAAPERKPEGRASDKHDDDHDHGGLTPLKIFALLVAIGLFVTTSIWLTIALGNRATRRVAWVMLALGIAVPVALILL
jgi:hypothetical protein